MTYSGDLQHVYKYWKLVHSNFLKHHCPPAQSVLGGRGTDGFACLFQTTEDSDAVLFSSQGDLNPNFLPLQGSMASG